MKTAQEERRSASFSRLLAWLIAAAALVAGAVLAFAAFQPAEVKCEAVDITGADWGRDFRLTGHDGRPSSLADFRGKAVALFFGYTHCPDMCPTSMAKLAEAVRLLGPDGVEVQGLFVTVDPKRDTPEVLAQYVPAFHPAFLGMFGDPQTTARTAKEFKVFYSAQPPNEHGSYRWTTRATSWCSTRRGGCAC